MFDILRLSFLVGILICLSVSDLRRGIIPNKIVYPAMLITIGFTLVSPEASIKMSLIGGAALAGLLGIPAVLLKRVGLGDVKLAALIGLMTGFPQGVIALFSGITLGGLAAIILLLLKIKEPKEDMPYAPFLSLGAIVVLLGEPYLLVPLLYVV